MNNCRLWNKDRLSRQRRKKKKAPLD